MMIDPVLDISAQAELDEAVVSVVSQDFVKPSLSDVGVCLKCLRLG